MTDDTAQTPTLEVIAVSLSRLFADADRPAQHDFAQCVAAALDAADPGADEHARVVAVQADTGTGKSRAYLAAAALAAGFGERVTIATHSHALMRQLVDHEVDIVRDLLRAHGLRHDFTVAVRLGRRNFVSAKRVEALLTSRPELAAWLDYSDDTQASGTFTEAHEQMGLQFPAGLTQDDLCVLAGEKLTAFDRHRTESGEADVVITSHAMLLADARRWGRVLTQRTERRITIIDEADALVNAAESDAVARVGFAALIALADKCGGVTRVRAVTRRLAQTADKRCVTGDSPAVSLVQELIEWLRELETEGDLEDERDQLLADLYEWLDNVDAHDAGSLVERGALSSATVDAGRVVSRLWSATRTRPAFLRAVVLVSATLAPNDVNDFTELLRRLGVFTSNANFDSQASQCIVMNDFGRMQFMLADRHVPTPFAAQDDDAEGRREPNPDWLDYALAGIKAARAEGGRVLVLAASYDDADRIGARLPDVLVHRRDIRLHDLLEPFRAAGGAVLVTPAAWAGLDLPRTIAHIVIPRIPFAPVELAVDAAYRLVAQARGWNADAMRGVLLQRNKADATRRLRQGIGRGIRVKDDQVKVWILDPRFPLPVRMIKDLRRRLTQGAASAHVELQGAIPRRFRDAYDHAMLFERKAVTA